MRVPGVNSSDGRDFDVAFSVREAPIEIREIAREEPAMTTPVATIEDPGSLWDIGAVAARLGVQVRHVRRLVSERRIPFIKWGRLLRFDPNEIEAWLDAARRPSTAG